MERIHMNIYTEIIYRLRAKESERSISHQYRDTTDRTRSALTKARRDGLPQIGGADSIGQIR